MAPQRPEEGVIGRGGSVRPYLEDHPSYSKWLVTTIYKPFRPFGRGITLLRALTNHGY